MFQLEEELGESQGALEQIEAEVSRFEGLSQPNIPCWRTSPPTAAIDGREVAWRVETALRCLRDDATDLEGERDHLIDLLFKAQVHTRQAEYNLSD